MDCLQPLGTLKVILLSTAFSLALFNHAVGQDETGNIRVEEEQSVVVKDTAEKPHSPFKATIYSAVLPGLGQAYNKKYWKIPIVYAGLGTTIYFISRNRSEYRRFRSAYLAEIDDDPCTTSEFSDRNISPDAIRSTMQTYQGYLELSYIFAVVVYGLNIVDANVDAHLFNFDVSDDLSLDLKPDFFSGFSGDRAPTTGLRLTLHFNQKKSFGSR